MKTLALILLLSPELALANVVCDTGRIRFEIIRSGEQYLITGNEGGRYTGRCYAKYLRSSRRLTLLQGTSTDAYERSRCYAEVSDEILSSEVSVPSDQTLGSVRDYDITCTGNLD